MKQSTILVLAISSLLTSCDNAKADVTVEGVSAHQASLEQEISQQLTNDRNCSDSPDADNCQLVEVRASKTHVPHGDRILVLDFGGLLPSLTSYRKRVFTYLAVDETGQYREATPSIRIPEGAKTILQDIIGGSEERVKASGFSSDLSLEFEEKYGSSLENFVSDHGTWSFTLLAEYAPTANFALAPALKIPNRMLCSFDHDGIKKYVERSATSLKDFIIDQKIEYINLSAGESIPYYQRVWPQLCPGSRASISDLKNVLAITANYYKALANIPGVTLVQAGVNGDVNADTYPIDCEAQAYPNRIRANYVTVVDSKIDAEGFANFDTKSLIDPANRNSLSCNDVYINAGFNDSKRPFAYGDFPLMVTDTGLGSYRYPSKMVTSFAAPVVTSFAIYLRHTFLGSRPVLDPQLPRRIRNMMNSDFDAIVQDPLKHKMFYQY
jgi:hypothetical protein